MRHLALLLLLVAGLALAQAGGITPDSSRRLTLTNCPAQGGDGGSVHTGVLPAGRYLFRVFDADTTVCVFERLNDGGRPDGCPSTLSDGGTWASDGGLCTTCTTDGGRYDGERFAAGTVFLWGVPQGGSAFSCSSPSDAGDVAWTRVQ